MHPIERLRYVARASGAPAGAVARESIGALMTFQHDPPGLLNACKRLVSRHPRSGPMLWMASCLLCSPEPGAEARRIAALFDNDETANELSHALPDDAVVTVVGWPETVGAALVRRGDVESLVVDAFGEGASFARRLSQSDSYADVVPLEGVARAVQHSDFVLLEASAVGPDQFVATAGSFAAAAIAYTLEVPVWLVAGPGRLLPGRLFDSLAARLQPSAQAYDDEDEFVPMALVQLIASHAGMTPRDEALAASNCPIAPELLGV